MLMKNVKLPGALGYDKHTEIHTSTQKGDISLAREFQKQLLDPSRKNGVIDQGKYWKWSSERKWTD